MSKVSEYETLRNRIKAASLWTGKIGRAYRGGGGGIGKVISVEVKPVVYHQESDGATNYHDCPELIRLEVQAVILEKFPEILALAEGRIEAKRAALAKEAVAEHASLLSEAGLAVES